MRYKDKKLDCSIDGFTLWNLSTNLLLFHLVTFYVDISLLLEWIVLLKILIVGLLLPDTVPIMFDLVVVSIRYY